MAGRIPQAFIDELVARVDIIDVIDERVPLKKSGKDYMACCPFHNEKTPSFSVSREKQFYHCFGCGAHGTSLGFLMEYDHLGFVDAVEELARRVGLDIPREAGHPEHPQEHAGLYEILERANTFFTRSLRDHPRASRAVDYLKHRGLTGQIAAEFAIGYAPPGWDNILRELGGSVESEEYLTRAGLVVRKDDGGVYDRFRDRITFPIQDRRGRVVAFGGRALGDEQPKYLNSPETPVFHKSNELYGLAQALKARRRLDRLVVVEGYMDVVALAQHGIRYAVATLGTAVTPEHVERLFRSAPHVIFCFDGDTAGRRAAWRALETALPSMRDGRQAGFMFLPEGDDPDTLVRRVGRGQFEEGIAEAISLATFLFEHLLGQVDTETLDGRARLVELAKPLVGKLPESVLQQLIVKRLAELSGMEVRELTTLIRGRSAPPTQSIRSAAKTSGRRASPSLVRRVISLVLHHPHLASLVEDAHRLRELELAGAPLMVDLLELLDSRPQLTIGGILEHFRDREAGRHLTKLAASDAPVLTEGLDKEFTHCIARLFQELEQQPYKSRYEYLSRKAGEGPLTEEEKQEYSRLIARFGPSTPGSRDNDALRSDS